MSVLYCCSNSGLSVLIIFITALLVIIIVDIFIFIIINYFILLLLAYLIISVLLSLALLLIYHITITTIDSCGLHCIMNVVYFRDFDPNIVSVSRRNGRRFGRHIQLPQFSEHALALQLRRSMELLHVLRPRPPQSARPRLLLILSQS